MRYQLTKAHGVAEVASVGDFNERRSLTELNGEGDVVSGIAMARYGENALNVISHIKAKIREISAGLTAGVSIHAVYDRSELIYKAISTLQRTLLEESLIVGAVCGVFLLHVRLAMVAILMAAGGRADGLHRHARAGHQRQPDAPGRHRDRHRRDGGRGDRDDRCAPKHPERLPEGHSVQQRADAMLAACQEVGPALLFSPLACTKTTSSPTACSSPARRVGGRVAGRHRHRAGRRAGDPDGGRARARWCICALPAGIAQQPARQLLGRCTPGGERAGHVPAGYPG